MASNTQPSAVSSQPKPVAPAPVAVAAATAAPDDALSVLPEATASNDSEANPPQAAQTLAASNAPQPQAKNTQSPDANAIYLQFGAFSAPENAQSLAQKLNQTLAQSENGPVQIQSAGHLYKVQMGPYANRTEAVNAAWRIQQQTGTQPNLSVATR
jgi:rare lipoprotein A